MDARNRNSTAEGLPYVNNIRSILFTVVVNTVCILLFCWTRTTRLSVMISAVSCGVVASVIITLISKNTVDRMRSAGTLPASVPQSKLMMRLPRNPVLLSLIFGVFFGGLALLVNVALIRFFEIQTFTLLRLLVWQGAYSCVLAAIICECAVLRYVQPDCVPANAPAQSGGVHVKNPMSRVNALKNWLGTVLVDFGFNMAVGLVFGSTRVAADHSVIINPTTRDGIVASSIVIGIIVTFRMAYPIMKAIYGARNSGQLPPASKPNGFLSALPAKPMRLTLVLMLPIIVLSFVVFWSVLTFFDFAILSFFQFFVIRSVYTAILSRGVTALALARYRQRQTAKDAAVPG